MVYLSRIYTKTGDQGETALGNGQRVAKDHPRVAAYGSVDELNAVLGLLLAADPAAPEADLLRGIQNDLFDVGADLCVPPDSAEATGKRLLAFMEEELQGRAWLLGGAAPSLADVAMVSYTSQAHLAGLPLEAYPRIAAWVARMQALPGYPVLADQLPAAEQVAA